MRILLNVPYYTGSHKYWADNLVRHSKHNIELLSMVGRHWKWRMEGSAIHLAHEFKVKYKSSNYPDIIVCSTMMDVALYKSLIDVNIPIFYFLHENQLTYPTSLREDRKEEFHYGFINYKSCLAADYLGFNSDYHLRTFTNALEKLLSRLPDYQSAQASLNEIRNKSKILWIGIELDRINKIIKSRKALPSGPPIILWNHRWEHDKNPQLFSNLLHHIRDRNIKFRLVLLGDNSEFSTIYKALLQDFAENILHQGFVVDFKAYVSLMAGSHIYPVTSSQDFYGISVLEAISCGPTPILPANRVYSDFVPELEYPRLFYHNDSELFSKVEQLIVLQGSESQSHRIMDKLENHSIHNVINDFDLHMSTILNSSYC